MATHGGARNRSGPVADENSGRSDRRGVKFTALPAEGYDGPIPSWPLSRATKREADVWAWLWRTPQACAWALPSEAWRLRTIALYARTLVRSEAPDVSASVLAQLHRFADQVGMTTAGLAEMGWKVAPDEIAARRTSTEPAATPSAPTYDPRAELRALRGNG